MRNTLTLKLFQHRAGDNISVFSKQFFKLSAFFCKISIRFIRNKHAFKDLCLTEIPFSLGLVTGFFDDFQDVTDSYLQ